MLGDRRVSHMASQCRGGRRCRRRPSHLFGWISGSAAGCVGAPTVKVFYRQRVDHRLGVKLGSGLVRGRVTRRRPVPPDLQKRASRPDRRRRVRFCIWWMNNRACAGRAAGNARICRCEQKVGSRPRGSGGEGEADQVRGAADDHAGERHLESGRPPAPECDQRLGRANQEVRDQRDDGRGRDGDGNPWGR